MFEGIDFKDLMSKAKDLQENLAKQQQEAETKTIDVSVGGGMVELTMNGKLELLSIKIDKDVIDPDDPEMIEDLVRAAVNEGLRRAKELSVNDMSKMMGNLNLPGMK